MILSSTPATVFDKKVISELEKFRFQEKYITSNLVGSNTVPL